MLTTVHLIRDRRKEQQQLQLASYMTEHGGDVVGFGDTRLGENAGIMDRLTKRATIERQQERQRQRDMNMNTTVGSGVQTTRTNGDARMPAAKVSWSSAGSSKNRNGAWLGGVAGGDGRGGEAATNRGS